MILSILAKSLFAQVVVDPLLDKYPPLQRINIYHPTGVSVEISDGHHNRYYVGPLDGSSIALGGALGYHKLEIMGIKGKVIESKTIRVNGKITLYESVGVYQELMDVLYWTMRSWGRDKDIVRINGEYYEFFVRWLRDHVHTLKGMKYYAPNMESGIDLYADHQRKDGMIWDNVYSRYFQKNWWEKRFAYGGFYQSIEPGDFEFKRMPVENDVEYLFIEGIYYTWKATGSDEWMKSLLDNSLLAVQYATTNEYRWSEKYQLLKRGYKIDTWDFQTNEDAEIAGDDIMVVFPDKTRFGVMFGDNTGMYAACHYLAEMLNYVGRSEEALKVRELGDGLKRRVDDVAWNGSHYTHHIPEDPTIKRDLGIAEASQVSLSNAYSLNRMIDHSQAKAIIETYQRIREEMPNTSQGEWYTIYPPFEQGFGRWDSGNKWEYMNGGVTSIVAGELAHGAFEHGFEDYGADILRRVRALAAKSNDYLECTYLGSIPEVPERNFTQLDLFGKRNGVYPNPQASVEGKTFFAGVDDRVVKSFRHVSFQIWNEQYDNTALIFS